MPTSPFRYSLSLPYSCITSGSASHIPLGSEVAVGVGVMVGCGVAVGSGAQNAGFTRTDDR